MTSAEYDHVDLTRSDDGVVELRLHTDGGPLVWSPTVHADLVRVFTALADDRDARVVIIGGTGAEFCTSYDMAAIQADGKWWDEIWLDGRRLLQRLAEIDVPVIGLLNGPGTVHAEILFLSDFVLAADTAFVKETHLNDGIVPGDGVHVIWPHLLGPARGKYFLWMDQAISAQQLHEYGAVSEVLPAAELRERAHVIAKGLTALSPQALRYTRALLADPLRNLLQQSLSHGFGVEGAASLQRRLRAATAPS